MIRGMIFDLDGTLVNSLPGITEALNRSLAEHNLQTYTEDEVTAFIGAGAQALADNALGERKAELGPQIFEGFQRHYLDTWQKGTQHFPGIPELLKRYQNSNMRLAVLSNKPHHHTVNIVTAMFKEGLFEFVFGARDEFPKKPDPTVALKIAADWGFSPSEVSYVGDSTVDLATAGAAGMLPSIMNWGYGAPKNHPLLGNATELEEFIAKVL